MIRLLFFVYFSLLFSLWSYDYKVGEELKYQIRWGIVHVGTSTMSIPKTIDFNGKKCLVLKSTAKSNSVIDLMFPVNDTIMSYYDPISQRPYWSMKDLNEGNYHKYNSVYYNFQTKTAHWTKKEFSGNDEEGKLRSDAKWKYKSGTTEKLPKGILDILSAVYYMRNHKEKAETGKSFTLNIFDDLEIAKLKMNLLRKETITLNVNNNSKTFSAIVVRPEYKTSGVFHSSGSVQIWISDDMHKIPLQIKANIKLLGDITVELIESNL